MMGGKPGSHFTTDGSVPTLTRGRGSVNDVHAIALDGDKLKPREDQRKGGNGFGVNEEGVGYTLTAVDRHGVAYCADGVSPTLQSRMGTGGNQVPLAVSTNSNGEDVAPTISSCEYKMGQKQKDTSGGYVVTRQEGAEGE